MSKLRIGWAAICGFLNPFSSVFESVSKCALDMLNKYLGQENVSAKITEAYGVASGVMNILVEYADWCPQKWRKEFDILLGAVKAVVDVFADGKVEPQEIDSCIDRFRSAYAEWNAD